MTDVLKHHRRHFLLGAGGLTLAIPTLTSLLPRSAQAAPNSQKRFIAMATDHGGVFPSNMYPTMPANAQSAVVHARVGAAPEHRVRFAPLTSRIEGANRVVSNTLTAPSSRFSERLLSQLNVLAGLDFPDYIGHNRSGFLGNYASNDQGVHLQGLELPTIDQIIGRSSTFNRNPVRQATINVARGYGSSSDLRYSQSVDLSLSPVPGSGDVRPLMNLIASDATASVRPPERLVHRVYEHYRNLTTGAYGDASRLSSGDRSRLTRHMDMLSSLEQRLSVTFQCGTTPSYTDQIPTFDQLKQLTELVAIAVMCGVSNVAVITSAGESFKQDDNYSNWHDQVVHLGGNGEGRGDLAWQRTNYRAHQSFFAEIFLRLAERLDVEESDGETFLDNTLMYWTQESGAETHTNLSQPIITAGGAGGFFHTGRFIDYRDPAKWAQAGVLYNQFFANVLQSMGIAPSTYAQYLRNKQPTEVANGARGYGLMSYHSASFWSGQDVKLVWPEHYYRNADELLAGWAVDA